jgi:hypothetical protein
MLVKIVDTVVSTDSAGRPVDAIPIREWEEGETSITGVPLAALEIEESDVGVPVRFVVGKTAQNSAGQWIDTIPTTGGGAPGWVLPGSKIGLDFANDLYWERGPAERRQVADVSVRCPVNGHKGQLVRVRHFHGHKSRPGGCRLCRRRTASAHY